MSGNIILDARQILALEAYEKIGEYAGYNREWLDVLWAELILEPVLMKEFMYYVDHHTFSGEKLCQGYDMSDMYVYQITKYNMSIDIGKNPESCNKEYLALGAFHDMYEMLQAPDKFIKKLNAGMGMDMM